MLASSLLPQVSQLIFCCLKILFEHSTKFHITLHISIITYERQWTYFQVRLTRERPLTAKPTRWPLLTAGLSVTTRQSWHFSSAQIFTIGLLILYSKIEPPPGGGGQIWPNNMLGKKIIDFPNWYKVCIFFPQFHLRKNYKSVGLLLCLLIVLVLVIILTIVFSPPSRKLFYSFYQINDGILSAFFLRNQFCSIDIDLFMLIFVKL